MPQITAIKPQKNKKRANVYLDGKFGFGIDLENLVKHGLKVEQELTQDEIEEILKDAEFKKIYDKLLNFATMRPRSRKEITDWFWKHKVHESIREDLIKKLEKLDLLGDLEFAMWWIKQRVEFKPRGKKALYSELLKKGVDKRVIKDALSEVEIDEVEMAKELIEKKSYKWEKYDGREKREKAGQYLARKGFNWNVIKEVLEEFLE